ncbi:ATP-binding protein [Malikia sp.]|uniref:ATP-binding protein n=1 Tax=Malikia sp. TaxID=2070706 RepID=UPI00263744D6|nr:ATP-binding protein [Malikia sp.]MDD2729288.1 ATP-binding protein [Malikia sp.]
MFPWIRRLDMRLGFIGKVSLALATTALLTALVAVMAWLSFSQVVDLQRRIIEDTVPAMEAVQAMTQLNTSALALVEQLGRAQAVEEVDQLQRSGSEQFAQAHDLLERLERQRFEPGLAAAVTSTVDAIAVNLERQAAEARRSLQLQAQISAELSRQQQAVAELMLIAEGLAANASTYTSATVSSLYPMLERGAGRREILASLDRLIEIDIDRMERMSELQLVCFRLKTKLERIEGLQDEQAVAELARDFSADLAVLARRLQDFRDPTRKAKAERLRAVLAAGLVPGGLFALQTERLVLNGRLILQHSEGAALASRLNEQGRALLRASRQAVEQVGAGSRAAIARGALGFLAVGALLLLALLATLWLIFRYDVLDRLKCMEASVRALMAGRYDVTISRSRAHHDPLASLVQALEQFREHAIERQRLEQALLQHQQQLEQQVVARTAELSRSKELLEREVEQHAAARREAEEANRAKNEFLGSLSHELRTPLSGVSGSVQLLGETALDARQREYLGMIAYANTTLLETLEDMLGFSRLEAGKLKVEPEPFSLIEVIDDMLALQSVLARAKGLALVRDVAADVPERIVGDRRKLNQVLLNTLGNAIKFTDEGEVTVSVTLVPDAVPGRLRLRFAVSDTGIGIEESQQEAVFRPFFQVEDTARRHHGGTGLGLAICQRLVTLMGGSMGLQSVIGEGTTVTFELPVDAAPAGVSPAPVPEHEGVVPMRALDVLVVEDDEINRIVCERYLESLGHRAHVAGDGIAALDLLRRPQQRFDCVLMDISLPGASGFDVAQAIHGLDGGRWRQLPVVGMSAHVTAETFEHQAAAGMAGFLGKPFRLGELSRALASAIGETAALVPDDGGQAAHAADALLDLAHLAEEVQDLGRPMLLQLLAMFRQESDKASAGLQAALQHGDLALLGRLAHKLRSAAGNLGLLRVMEDCRQVEQAAKDGGQAVAKMSPLVSRLAQDCGRSADALEQWLTRADQAGRGEASSG